MKPHLWICYGVTTTEKTSELRSWLCQFLPARGLFIIQEGRSEHSTFVSYNVLICSKLLNIAENRQRLMKALMVSRKFQELETLTVTIVLPLSIAESHKHRQASQGPGKGTAVWRGLVCKLH